MSSGGAAETNGPSSAPARPRGDGQGRERGRGRGRGNQTGSRGGKSQRGRGRGQGQGGAAQQQQPATKGADDDSSAPSAQTKKLIGTTTPAAGGEADGDDVEAEVCFICASPVVHQSVAPCNHRTCHICSLRMRALYKNKECAHCRTASQYVIFTDDATKRFEDYSTDAPDITSVDDNIGIRYAKEDIVGDTVLLLRYNCPDVDCDFAGLGWPDLHRHVRSTHNKKMCDLCTRNKKVFTHEHELFTDKELEKHMRNGDDRPGAVDQTGFRGHPLCAFCGSRFYDDDKLYEHCRNKHERCFLCDREDPRQPHYYMDYNALEKHFQKDHYLCSDRECQEKKFVVFASELDLKAHQLSEHGSTLSKDVRRDARLVDMAGFDFRQPYQQERRGGGGGGGGGDREGGRGGRGRRGRDPNAEPIPASSAQALRRDEQAFQRQMAIHSSQSVSNRTFGGQLSSSSAGPLAAAAPRGGQAGQRNGASAATSASPAPEPAPTAGMEGLSVTDPNLTPEERARLVRHASVVERASNLLQNDANKMATFRAKISAYRQDSIGPAALVESFFSLFSETSTTALGTLVREVADLFEDKGKAERLRKAWNDWRAINEDYPTLPSLSGMHGATTQSSGWAAAASSSASAAASNVPATQRHTTRVLKLKNMTQQSQRSNSQKQQSGSSSSWAASAGSTASRPPPTVSFPSLPPARASASKNTSAKGPQPSGPSSSAATSASLWGPSSHNQPSGSSSNNNVIHRAPKPASGSDNFPALPAAPKPLTTIFGYGRGAVRRDMGGSRDTGFNWSERSGDTAAGAEAEEEADATDAKGKKKKQKKVLVQWG